LACKAPSKNAAIADQSAALRIRAMGRQGRANQALTVGQTLSED